ncbi:ABC transporter permease [Stetteria hydrogenophila]
MGRLRVLAAKEFRELVGEKTVLIGMIVMPLVIFTLLGAVEGAALRQTIRAAEKPVAAIVAPAPGASEADRALARALAGLLNATYAESLPAGGPWELLEEGYKAVVVVPAGASGNLTRGLPARVQVYVSRSTPSFTEASVAQAVAQRVEQAGRAILASILAQYMPGLRPETIASPLVAETAYYMRGRILTPAEMESLTLTTLFIPMVLLIMLLSAAQVAATSIGLEREAKTLEMLLTAPVSRWEIVVSKVAGTLGVALLGFASFTAGFLVYYRSLKPVLAEGAAGLSLGVLPAIAPALAASLYVSLILGLTLGMAAGDVRGAQLAASQATFILILPYFAALMGFTPSIHGPGAALLLDPLYPVFQATVSSITGDAQGILASYAALAGHAAAWTILAAKLFNPEALLTGYNLKARLLKRRAAPAR